MSDSARDLLTRGIAAAKADEPQQAKKYLLWSLRNRPDPRQQVDALYWLARLSEGAEKEDYLLEVLQIEPTHYAARRDLAVLRGDLRSEDLVDPLQPELPAQPEQIAADERRFDCPQCGGRMEYDAAERQLVCRYCDHRARLTEALSEGAAVFEEDFIQALATARGHLHPRSMATFECTACGATYLLEPDTISLTCAHCASTYTIKTRQQSDLIPPEGIIPFTETKGQAGRRLRQWLSEQDLNQIDHLGPMRGLYLPIWTFDISGEAPYHYQRYDGDNWVSEQGSQLLLYNDLPIPASHRLPKHFAEEVHNFDMNELQPFDPSKIAGWAAETYEIPARRAAMAARWHVVDRARQEARSKLFGRTKDFQLRSADLLIAAYRLALVPFWLTSYRYQGQEYKAVVNGQTGNVRAEAPRRGLLAWLQKLVAGGEN